MRAIVAAVALFAVVGCTAQHGNNASDERAMHAAGAGVTVSSEEVFAAAKRAPEVRASEVSSKAATATAEVQ